MATILRELSYKYQWLYDSISSVAALIVGGSERFRRLPLQNLTINSDSKVLDLCCGSGQVTGILVELSQNVIGLDASPLSLQRAKKNVPKAKYVEGWAEKMPFDDESFDLVHISAALHEMTPTQLKQILEEINRVLKPGGICAIADFHPPTNPLFWPPLSIFFWLFETETAWELLNTNLVKLLEEVGLKINQQVLYAGGSLQIIQAQK